MVAVLQRKAQTGRLDALGVRLERLTALLAKLQPIPEEWHKSAATASKRGGRGTYLECTPCTNYSKLVESWHKALKWTDGLDHALTVMLASIASVKGVGDQLWIKVIGPAACGKSTLCEAVSVNRKYILAKSTIRGFHSGFKTQEGEDNSLVAKIGGKTLVTKDGDTLLQSPNLGQILSEARDLYDCTSRTHYRNKVAQDYQGIRMTWLLCGTSSLRSIDASELGERFLDCVIMEGIDEELEDAVLWHVAKRAARNLTIESDGKAETHYEPELAVAMQLTGGYVNWLRENAIDVLSTIGVPQWALRRCTQLGKFVAFMRARPSLQQEETAEREFGARLVSQHIRLAGCLALVLNHKAVDEEVMQRVKRVALDTSRGQTLAIADALYGSGKLGVRSLAAVLSESQEKVKGLLRFLGKIGVTEAVVEEEKNQRKWRLTERMQLLYKSVVTTKQAKGGE